MLKQMIASLILANGKETEIVEQPSNYPPEGLNPIQVGCVLNGKVDERDIISGFYYLAQKGYMIIREYELQRFEFEPVTPPVKESEDIKLLYKAIFGVEDKTVKLIEAKDRLVEALPRVERLTIKSINKKKNRDLAELTGQARGFKQFLIHTKGDKAKSILIEDKNYIYTVLPYAYELAITAKLASNFNIVDMVPPTWYYPYGVDEEYVFDVVVYNSMLRNLPEELKELVFDEINIRARMLYET